MAGRHHHTNAGEIDQVWDGDDPPARAPVTEPARGIGWATAIAEMEAARRRAARQHQLQGAGHDDS